MSAPTKQGIDYFPFDVDLLDDEALDRLREKYGCVINDVYIALLCLLYKKYGYYIPYETKKEQDDCTWYVFKKVRGGKFSPRQSVIPELIEGLVAGGLFSADHYPKIITSERAQETYYTATVERKTIDINPEYWIVSDDRMRKLSQKHPYWLSLHKNGNSDGQNPYSSENQCKSSENQCKSSEKPLKESKGSTIKKVSKKDISINESDDGNVPQMRDDGTYDLDEVSAWERKRPHAAIMDELGVSGIYRTTLENFLRYCHAHGHFIMNDKLTDIICRLDNHYGQGDEADEEKAKSLESAMRLGYYDVKEK